MSSSAEGEADSSDPYIVEAHAGQRLRVIEDNGKHVEFKDPGNFQWVLQAYLFNRYGEVSPNRFIQKNQEFLAITAIGQEVSESLATLFEDDQSEALVHETFKKLPENEMAYRHAQIIERVSPHLPEGMSDDVLRDPWRFDQAA